MNLASELYEQAFRAAEDGVAAETRLESEQAIALFEQAIRIFSRLAIVESKEKRRLLEDQITDFRVRIVNLKAKDVVPQAIQQQVDVVTPLSEAERLEEEAKRSDEEKKGPVKIVLDAYMQAADSYMTILHEATMPEDVLQQIKDKVEGIIDRVTQLKKDDELELLMEEELIDEMESFVDEAPPAPVKEAVLHAPVQLRSPTNMPRQVHTYEENEDAKFTSEELDVLRRSSIINGRLFQPWIVTDGYERFDVNEHFIDPDGFLSMSPQQMEKLDKWVRPTGYGTGKPVMIAAISPYCIVQDVVTDCSFVASLCITAAYEQRFQKKLITKIIYPQDEHGNPLVNPGGKYFVKLWANGVPRKVVVDDCLPLGYNGVLLCSCTTTPNELWVSIIEKAYLKVNGGYDFPGSNSGIDLFALTGWIPESLSFVDSTASSSDVIWQRLISAYNFGDCLITIATGDMSSESAKLVGLVPSHAYAVLNVVETSSGVRLLQVKNPWNRKRWKGPYSLDDTQNWTPALQRELGFDLALARQAKDDGLFWIDFRSVQKHFNALFLNWNPELFKHRYTIHKHWPVEVGPTNDTYNLGYNPQYLLTIPNAQNHTKACSIWILLSRHVTSVETPEAVQQFLTLHVYKQDKRVYYPNFAFARGTYSNNPHNLTCLDINLTEGESTSFILVMSQYEKLTSLDYTISVFSTEEPFEFKEAPAPPPHSYTMHDQWSALTAGGCPKYGTFLNNPQYQVVVTEALPRLLITLEAPVQYPINLRLIRDGQRVGTVSKKTLVAQSGEYRPGFCYIETQDLAPGEYTLVPSTFEPYYVGSFVLTLASTIPKFHVYTLPPEGHGMQQLDLSGKWNTAAGTAVGCSNFGRYLLNPQYLVHIEEPTHAFFRLRSTATPCPSINISVYECGPSGQLRDGAICNPTAAFMTSGGAAYTNSASGARTKLTPLTAGFYLVIPSTYEPTQADFDLISYSDIPLKVTRLR
ncbi:calpain-like protease [Thraustotheca clavata]|uniref:Calpain-like protease n=1 Tax=Thraustotheca clavata TaxID=74557 RepID=A0A1V9YSL9_9STRA|nr:calpain-like protease [Thraustotheca clavata]